MTSFPGHARCATHVMRRMRPTRSHSKGSPRWLWVTPTPSRPAPIGEGIIEGAAAGAPDPVSGDPRPRTAGPPAGKTIRAPTRRNRSAVPLARGAGCSTPVTVPTVGHWIPAWTQRPAWTPIEAVRASAPANTNPRTRILGLLRASMLSHNDPRVFFRPARRHDLAALQGVLCAPAPTRASGSSSRTWNTPPAVSTFAPTHQRETNALARGASAK